MVYVIAHPAVQRGKLLQTWWARATLFALSALGAGVALGAILGVLGSTLNGDARRLVFLAFTMMGFVAAGAELLGRPLPMLQLNRETSRRGMGSAIVWWTIRNGVAMGAGVMTRIGFWMWYVVPVASFLSAKPSAGVVIYGSYGAARGLAPLLILLLQRRTSSTHLMLIRNWQHARRISAWMLLTTVLGAGMATLLQST